METGRHNAPSVTAFANTFSAPCFDEIEGKLIDYGLFVFSQQIESVHSVEVLCFSVFERIQSLIIKSISNRLF